MTAPTPKMAAATQNPVGAVGRPDLYRRAIGNPPGAQEPGSSGRAGAPEAALRDCPGLPPVS